MPTRRGPSPRKRPARPATAKNRPGAKPRKVSPTKPQPVAPQTPARGPRSRPAGFATESRALQAGFPPPTDTFHAAAHPEERRRRAAEIMAPAFIDRSRPEAKSFESARTRPVRGKDRASRSGQGAADRDRGRLEALAREDRKAASTYVRSDYFGTAEHRALAEQLKRLLATDPVLGAPAADPSHVLVVR
jgi:hypothetical protein